MIPASAWKAHLAKPTFDRSLPDGTPLTWTPGKADLFEDISGVYQPVTVHDCELFLWVATLDAETMIRLWRPAPPVLAGDPALPRHRFQQQLEDALRWRDATIPVAARGSVLTLVTTILEREYTDALEYDAEADADAAEDPEKKSQSAALTGSSPLSTPLAPIPPAGSSSFTISPSAPSSPPTEPGSTPMTIPSSPPPDANSVTG